MSLRAIARCSTLLLIATPAAASPDGVPSLVELLDAHVGGPGLGAELSAAVAALSPRESRPEAALATRRSASGTSLGIGALSAGDLDTVAYPSIYARSDAAPVARRRATPAQQRSARRVFAAATQRISACYGDPLKTAESGSDSLTLAVTVDRSGAPLVPRLATPPRWAESGSEACMLSVARSLRFPALGAEVEVSYTWTFRSTATVIVFN